MRLKSSFYQAKDMQFTKDVKPAEIPGITYYYAADGATIAGRDGKVEFLLDFPVPLLSEDHGDCAPSYDAVGRGIYYLLRANPDAPYSNRYALLLRDAYPHLLAELSTHLMMLDKKDVDLPYLDRKITYLKIFTLLDPANAKPHYEIGATFFDKAMTLASMGRVTLNLFAAEKHLKRAWQLAPDDTATASLLGDVCWFLGKYEEAQSLWQVIVPTLDSDAAEKLSGQIAKLAAGDHPLFPAVDCLQAVGVALEAFEEGGFEEAAAIILDVIDLVNMYERFPRAEINYLLGLCYVKMEIPKYAEEYLREAIKLRADFSEALAELANLGVQP